MLFLLSNIQDPALIFVKPACEQGAEKLIRNYLFCVAWIEQYFFALLQATSPLLRVLYLQWAAALTSTPACREWRSPNSSKPRQLAGRRTTSLDSTCSSDDGASLRHTTSQGTKDNLLRWLSRTDRDTLRIHAQNRSYITPPCSNTCQCIFVSWLGWLCSSLNILMTNRRRKRRKMWFNFLSL